MEHIMRRICRALATLMLGLVLAAATTAVAAATTAVAAAMPPTGTPNPHDQLAQRKALYQSELEHNLATARAASAVAAHPVARTARAASRPDVDVPATLLVGLVAGLLGGAAAMVGWTAATRRRPRGRLRRPAAGT
jgi:hypothetical protein